MVLSTSILASVSAMHPLSMLSATVTATVLSHDLHHLGSLRSPWKSIQRVVLSGMRHIFMKLYHESLFANHDLYSVVHKSIALSCYSNSCNSFLFN